MLHHWGTFRLRGDHNYPSLSNPEHGNPGKGLLLWFVIDDFDEVWVRAQALGACSLLSVDGYCVAVNESR